MEQNDREYFRELTNEIVAAQLTMAVYQRAGLKEGNYKTSCTRIILCI